MDPDQALKNLLEAARFVLGGEARDMFEETAEELAQQVLDLDEWLRKAGFLPEPWRPQPAPEAQKPPTPRYACPMCGALAVELCFPVWVRANEMDNRELWDLDAEASPEKDSDKGWCIECQANVLVRVKPEGGRR